MQYVIVRMPPDVLAHYGVKGMKWGVRNYQNKDGTLTELGKSRLREKRKNAKAAAADDGQPKTLSIRHKKVKDLPTSDPELVRKGEYWYNQNGEMLPTFSFDEGKKPIRGTPRVLIPNAVEDHVTRGKQLVERTIYDDKGVIAIGAHGGTHIVPQKKQSEKDKPAYEEHIHEHLENGERILYPTGDGRPMTEEEKREHADVIRRSKKDSD